MATDFVLEPVESFEDVVKRLLDARTEQGLPPTVEDAAALEQIAAVIRDHHAETARKNRRGVA